MQRKLEDMETTRLLIEMKEEAERIDNKRKSLLSTTSASKAPSAAAGRPGEDSLLRKSVNMK